MESHFFTFKVEDLINTYKQNLLAQQGDNINPKDKTQFETVLFEIETKEKALDSKKRACNKEFFLNLDILINNLITSKKIKNGFAVCSSGTPTASVYVNHFEKGAMSDLSKALRKKFRHSKIKALLNLFNKDDEETEGKTDADLKKARAKKVIPTAKATAIGRSALVLIIDGKLSLGKFDNVVYAEFDFDPKATFTVALFSDAN